MAANDSEGVVTLRCDRSVDSLLRRAVASIEAHGLDVFEVIDHGGDAADVGLTIPDTKLVLFADPRIAADLMRAHPRIALDLPLKLLIHAGIDGNAFVSYHTPAFLAGRHGLTDREAEMWRVVETIAFDTRQGH